MISFRRALLLAATFTGSFISCAAQTQASAPEKLDLRKDILEMRRLSEEDSANQQQSLGFAEDFGIASSDQLAQVMPALMKAVDDSSSTVRLFAISYFNAAARGTGGSGARDHEAVLGTLAPYLPRILTHLDDSDRRIRVIVMFTYPWFFGRPEARTVILPALLKELSPTATKSAASATVGPTIVGEVAQLGRDDPEVNKAVIEYLNRADHSPATVADMLHNLALVHANERVNNEIIRLVFERRAMSIFLLQFLTRMPLTPTDLSIERARLSALADDPSAHAALRRAAKTVVDCWTGDTKMPCEPSEEDLRTQPDTRHNQP